MILKDIIDLARAGWSFKQVKEALEFVETNPVTQEAKSEDVEQTLEQLKTIETVPNNANDPEVQLGAFARLAKEE